MPLKFHPSLIIRIPSDSVCARAWSRYQSNTEVDMMLCDEFETEHCFTVVSYGTILKHTNILPLAAAATDVIRNAGDAPTHLGVTAPTFGNNPLLFSRAWARLQKAPTEHLVSVRRLQCGAVPRDRGTRDALSDLLDSRRVMVYLVTPYMRRVRRAMDPHDEQTGTLQQKTPRPPPSDPTPRDPPVVEPG